LKENVQFIEGIIENEHIDIDVTVESTECGLGIAYFYIEIEDGSPVSFSIQANFRGPIINLVEPVIDLGLTKVNTVRTF